MRGSPKKGQRPYITRVNSGLMIIQITVWPNSKQNLQRTFLFIYFVMVSRIFIDQIIKHKHSQLWDHFSYSFDIEALFKNFQIQAKPGLRQENQRIFDGIKRNCNH